MPLSDKPETEAASEEVGTSKETLESADSTIEVSEDEETSSEDSSESTPEPETLYAGRFKSAEALAESYQHLEREFTRKSNELHNLRSQQTHPAKDPEAEVLRFAEALKRNPIEAIRDVTRGEVEQARGEAKQIRFETAYNQMKTNKEFVDLEPTMSRLATEWEELIVANNLQNDPRLLNVLFLAAKGSKQGEMSKTAEARGKQKGELSALKKTKAQVEGSSGTKGHTNKNFEELSLAEMEKELLKQEKASA